jgi:hypothetical protein
MKYDRICISLPAELNAKLAIAAAEAVRSKSNMATLLLEKALAEQSKISDVPLARTAP